MCSEIQDWRVSLGKKFKEKDEAPGLSLESLQHLRSGSRKSWKVAPEEALSSCQEDGLSAPPSCQAQFLLEPHAQYYNYRFLYSLICVAHVRSVFGT